MFKTTESTFVVCATAVIIVLILSILSYSVHKTIYYRPIFEKQTIYCTKKGETFGDTYHVYNYQSINGTKYMIDAKTNEYMIFGEEMVCGPYRQ